MFLSETLLSLITFRIRLKLTTWIEIGIKCYSVPPPLGNLDFKTILIAIVALNIEKKRLKSVGKTLVSVLPGVGLQM